MALALLILPFVAGAVLVISALVFIRDGASPFFGHVRVGRGGRLFRCWKVRSMVPNAEAKLEAYLAEHPDAAEEWGAYHKLTDDPRITPVGEVLRKTSLDELPQLWNVIKGEMSFVGPRPVTPDELEKYGPGRNGYCAMRPGITGLWQVSGRNEVTYDERVQLDMKYLRDVSFWKDLSIILRTALVVVRPTGR
ncbi:MAG: sugar transferase, partial [Pseudomonadota bacterium]